MEHCREKKAAADRRGESGKAISILLLAGLALSIVLSMDIGIWALEGWCDVLSEGRLPVGYTGELLEGSRCRGSGLLNGSHLPLLALRGVLAGGSAQCGLTVAPRFPHLLLV